MYTLTKEQIASVESFIAKNPDSIVKSQYEKWLAEVRPTERITSEQLETFLSYANALPLELQNFPQSFVHTIKNAEVTERREEAEGTEETAELTATLDESIAGVKEQENSGAKGKNSEETLHKLNTKKGSTGGKPLSKAAPIKSAAKKTGKK